MMRLQESEREAQISRGLLVLHLPHADRSIGMYKHSNRRVVCCKSVAAAVRAAVPIDFDVEIKQRHTRSAMCIACIQLYNADCGVFMRVHSDDKIYAL